MNNEKEILQGISDIISVSNELNIKAYIWGGYVQDIMEGKILREHGDIDMFIENMDKNVNELSLFQNLQKG
jgi:tRNA nucleotidyltransferase/poly(A) polymerase